MKEGWKKSANRRMAAPELPVTGYGVADRKPDYGY
jgi:hypothetical protein